MNHLIHVLYEDQACIVFDKPPGLLVVPTPKNEQKTLVNIVNHQYAERSVEGRLYPCHRLDRDTSGAIIFAKSKNFEKVITALFYQKVIKKIYLGIAQGCLRQKVAELRMPVLDLDAKKFSRNPKPQPAVTRYKVVGERKHFSVLEIQPITGRTNQIRIHFAQIGHPLIGERKYAFGKDSQIKFRRPALHAWRLEWISPFNRQKILVESPLAKDMEEVLIKGGLSWKKQSKVVL